MGSFLAKFAMKKNVIFGRCSFAAMEVFVPRLDLWVLVWVGALVVGAWCRGWVFRCCFGWAQL